MALVGSNGGAQPVGGMAAPAQASAPVETDENTEALRQKKNEASKRFKERRQKEREASYKAALALRDELQRAGLMDRLTPASKAFVLELCRDPAERARTNPAGFGGPSILSQLFGESPKVGQSITLEDVFHKTSKGKSTMDIWVRRAAEKGYEIQWAKNPAKPDDIFTSTYTIMKLPS